MTGQMQQQRAPTALKRRKNGQELTLVVHDPSGMGMHWGKMAACTVPRLLYLVCRL